MQFKKISYDLISEKATVIERDRSSFFDIWIPKELCLGNNEIKLRLIKDDVFKKGSDILIELVDTKNNPLYYSISEIANEDQSRSIIVKVTEENVNGKCQLRFLCKFVNNESYLCIINLEINNRIENNQNIRFQSEPIVTYTEHRALLQKTSQVNRKVNKPNQSGLIFQKETIHPRQLQQENIRIEKPEISNKTIVNNVNSNTGSGVFENIPSFTSPTVIHSIGYAFSSSMQFGIITIPELNYSASILNVINTGSIEVWPPYSGSYKNVSNFTCSFNDSLTITNSELSQSYAIFDLKNLNTYVGVVDSVDINYKVLNQIGTDYQPLGNYKVRNYNYLTDLNTLRFDSTDGIVEQAIGRFETTSQFNQYWESSSLITVSKSDSVKNSIQISGSNFNIKPRSRTEVKEDDVLEVYFDYFNHTVKQLDVYISGSKIEQLTEQRNIQNNPNQNLGSYLGSVTEKQGSFSSKFRVLNSSYIHPIFYFNSGSWSLGNIELRSVKIQGYTPTRTKIIAPLDFPSGSELNFKLIYVNPTGKRLSTIVNEIKGVFFSGNTQITGTGTSTPLPPGLVSGSDQLTGSYDTRYEQKGTGILSSSQQIKNDISGSFTDISSSFQVRITNLENRSGSYVNTGSYNTDSGSWNTKITDLTNKTGSYATTGSNQFNGNQSISGSLTVSSSVSATNFTGIFNGQPSSSAQIKVLLPTGTVSGSEQLTGSYDIRYERKGTGIFSSSQQIGATGIYSGSGQVPRDTIVSSSNIKFETNINNDHWHAGFQFEQNFGTNNSLDPYSGSLILYTGNDGDDSRTYQRISGEETLIETLNKVTSENSQTGIHVAYQHVDAQHTSGSESTIFRIAGQDINFQDNRTIKRGIEYVGNYSASLKDRDRSLPDVGIVKLLISQSGDLYTSSYDTRYEKKGTNIVSSSAQIKVLLPTGTTSGSEQLTSSYDTRYHRLGTGLLSSSNQIATDISGSTTILSSSLATRITVFENKTLYSSSQYVDYNQINNKPIISNVGNNRIITSDGTVSGSRANDRFEYISSSNDNRVRLRNDVNFEQGYSSSFWSTEWNFVSQSFFQFNQTNRNKTIYIPLAFNNDTNAPITASLIHNSYAVEVKLHIYALTGSKSSPLNTYSWSSTTQFRILNNPKDSGAVPLFSNIVAQSSSQYAGLGGYGTTFTGKADLNSWHYINSVTYNNAGSIEFGFGVAPTSSFFWDGYVAIVANVIKHEIRV